MGGWKCSKCYTTNGSSFWYCKQCGGSYHENVSKRTSSRGKSKQDTRDRSASRKRKEGPVRR
eukprot:8712317-Pyramimonas_sp.AAC.1